MHSESQLWTIRSQYANDILCECIKTRKYSIHISDICWPFIDNNNNYRIPDVDCHFTVPFSTYHVCMAYMIGREKNSELAFKFKLKISLPPFLELGFARPQPSYFNHLLLALLHCLRDSSCSSINHLRILFVSHRK